VSADLNWTRTQIRGLGCAAYGRDSQQHVYTGRASNTGVILQLFQDAFSPLQRL